MIRTRRIEPREGQESVWDYPRPPRLERVERHIQIVFNEVTIADTVSAWSDIAFWEMGLFDSSNWQADWITPDWDEDVSRAGIAAPIVVPIRSDHGRIARH